MTSDTFCTNCSRNFLVRLDLSLEGNHLIECPFCHHIHYRVIQNGQVTEARWDKTSGMHAYTAPTSTVVTPNINANNINMSASWLNRSDLDF